MIFQVLRKWRKSGFGGTPIIFTTTTKRKQLGGSPSYGKTKTTHSALTIQRDIIPVIKKRFAFCIKLVVQLEFSLSNEGK